MIEGLATIKLSLVQPIEKSRGELGGNDLPLRSRTSRSSSTPSPSAGAGRHSPPGHPIRRRRVDVPADQPAAEPPRLIDGDPATASTRSRITGSANAGSERRSVLRMIVGTIDLMRIIGTDAQLDGNYATRGLWSTNNDKARSVDLRRRMDGFLPGESRVRDRDGPVRERRIGESPSPNPLFRRSLWQVRRVAASSRCRASAALGLRRELAQEPFISFGGIGPLVEPFVNFSRLEQRGRLPAR